MTPIIATRQGEKREILEYWPKIELLFLAMKTFPNCLLWKSKRNLTRIFSRCLDVSIYFLVCQWRTKMQSEESGK